MKEFLENRGQYIIATQINYISDLYNDSTRMSGMLDNLHILGNQIEESATFLSERIPSIKDAVDRALTVTENRISYLLSAVSHLNKLKLAAPSSASEVDIKLIDMTSGTYSHTEYSSSDGGLIMSSINTVPFREK